MGTVVESAAARFTLDAVVLGVKRSRSTPPPSPPRNVQRLATAMSITASPRKLPWSRRVVMVSGDEGTSLVTVEDRRYCADARNPPRTAPEPIVKPRKIEGPCRGPESPDQVCTS